MSNARAKNMDIVVVLTVKNEVRDIEAAIQSSRLLTSKVIVIDTGSTDDTVEKARQLDVPVYTFEGFDYVEPTRNFALQTAAKYGNWAFILDADERFTPELVKEIHQTIANTPHTHFSMPRKNIFAGRRWLQHGGWYPGIIMRLIHIPSFVNWPANIHSTPEIKGEKGALQQPLIHLFHPSLDESLEKTILFEGIEAKLLFDAHKSTGSAIFARKFLGELYRRLIKFAGWKDGLYGHIESLSQAFSKTVTYILLYERYKKNPTR